MKNYTYGYVLEERGYKEASYSKYTPAQRAMGAYIDDLSTVVKKANCGWSGVEYVLMESKYECVPFMVLCVGGRRERWIPIDGNSKGCNLQVLGENLW